MTRSGAPTATALTGLVFALLAGCASAPAPSADAADGGFASMQARGEQVMGVDQYTSTHVFDAFADGGRIELQRDVDDAAGIARIRSHLREIVEAFTAGDFSTPAFVHMQAVDGADVMAELHDEITYTYRDLPRGGEVRIVTSDPRALRAIHEFMAFQRRDHRAGGAEHGGHGGTGGR